MFSVVFSTSIFDGHQLTTFGTTGDLTTNIAKAGVNFITNGNTPSDWTAVAANDADGANRAGGSMRARYFNALLVPNLQFWDG